MCKKQISMLSCCGVKILKMSCIGQSALFIVNHSVVSFELLVRVHTTILIDSNLMNYASDSQHLPLLHDVICLPNQALDDDQENGDRCWFE